MTKTEATFEYLQKHGKITSWDAIMECKNTRLSATIFRFRQQGMKILTERKDAVDSFGNRCSYAEYRLVREG